MKKAATKKLVNWILAIVLLVIVLMFLAYYEIVMRAKIPKKICQNSVFIHAITHVRGISAYNDLKCPTRYKTISTGDGEGIKKELADAMYDCWDQYLQGRYELFTNENVYCAVCEVVDFKDRGQQLKRFNEFLFDNSHEGDKISYMDFLMRYDSPKAKQYIDNPALYNKQDPRIDEEYIDTSTKKAIVFVYAKGKDPISNFRDWIGPGGSTVGAGLGMGVGAAGASAGASGVTTAIILESNPVGWIVTGVGAIAIGAGSVFVLAADYNVGWVSFVVLKDYDAEQLKKTGCKTLPVSQGTGT